MSKETYRGAKKVSNAANAANNDNKQNSEPVSVKVEEKKSIEELEAEKAKLQAQIDEIKKREAAEKARKEAEEKAAAEAREKAEAAERARKEAEEKAEAERKRTRLMESAKIENRFPIHKVDGSLDIENPFSSALVAKYFDSRYAVMPYLVVRDVAIRPATSQEARSYRPDLTKEDLDILSAKF